MGPVSGSDHKLPPLLHPAIKMMEQALTYGDVKNTDLGNGLMVEYHESCLQLLPQHKLQKS